MSLGKISAQVITCPGRLGDFEYAALQIEIEGFDSPYVLTLALPAVGCHALSEQVDPVKLYNSIAQAINGGQVTVELPDGAQPVERKVTRAGS